MASAIPQDYHPANPMHGQVDLYNSAYSNLTTDVLSRIRRHTYEVDFGQSSWITATEFQRFFDLLHLTESSQVLDVCCGSGGAAIFMAKAVGCRVTGVDINDEGIRAGMAQIAQAGLNERVQLRQADACSPIVFESESFDAIICIDAVNHLQDRRIVLEHWRRLLRPDGRALFTDPVVVTGLVSKDEFATRASIGYFEFGPPGMNERLINAAGLEILRVEDVTKNEQEVSRRWHDAREACAAELIQLEGEDSFTGLQRFLETVHRTTAERRLSRFAYLVGRPTL
jgi:cyclopropane fatty-acyl-phospholipid synthase-like methyltransferase